MAAAAALASGAALTSAPAALAAPTAGPTAPAPQGQGSLVTITTSGMPKTVTAGTSVELTSTLKNTADHQVDVTTDFVVNSSNLKEEQLKLQVQKPGSTQWQDAKLRPGWNTGAWWELDPFATELHLPAGGSVTYQLRLTFSADISGGEAGSGLSAVVSDPTLPPEQRGAPAWGSTPSFTVVPVGGPTTPPPVGLPDVKVEDVPASFTAGGEAKAFKAVYSNHTGKDLRIVPAIVFQGEHPLPADVVKLEFQTQQGQWLAATPAPLGDIPSPQLGVELRTGNKDADVIPLPDGETRTVNLRLAWSKGAPVGAESVFANGYSLAGPGGTERGTSSPAVDFAILPAAAATGTPAPTTPVTSAPAAPATVAAAVPAAQVTTGAPSPAAEPVQVAAAAAPAPAAVEATRLASTGGGSSSAPMAITGATAIALGIGTLVVARRRQRAQGAGN
ncbi:hypothetical protein ACFC1T_02075 [Kitasatospora sp. NPDC056076]|uniref:hypothetical protein n=1 Tax=Kitasatospora sp. NPDC056076 TaxID=3345703 RepID=UPI0035E03ABB